jgi:hypothetical protein
MVPVATPATAGQRTAYIRHPGDVIRPARHDPAPGHPQHHRTPARRISLAWAGPVPRRVAALLAPHPQRRTLLLATTGAILLLAGASALEAARDLHTLLELARAAR